MESVALKLDYIMDEAVWGPTGTFQGHWKPQKKWEMRMGAEKILAFRLWKSGNLGRLIQDQNWRLSKFNRNINCDHFSGKCAFAKSKIWKDFDNFDDEHASCVHKRGMCCFEGKADSTDGISWTGLDSQWPSLALINSPNSSWIPFDFSKLVLF